MFGRLNEKKRVKAVELLNEMTDRLAGLFITWSTENDFFPTPRKFYIDELYVLTTLSYSPHYLNWRKNREDAQIDVVTFISQMFSRIYDQYYSEWPFRLEIKKEEDGLQAFCDLIDTRLPQYERSLHDELVNIEAETRKEAHKQGGVVDRHVEFMGSVNADLPFVRMALNRLFDVDENSDEQFKEYCGFGFQILPAMTKHSEMFMKYLKRL